MIKAYLRISLRIHLHRGVICDYCWLLFAATGATPAICALSHSVFMQITLRCSLSLYESPQGKDRANFRLADVQGEG